MGVSPFVHQSAVESLDFPVGWGTVRPGAFMEHLVGLLTRQRTPVTCNKDRFL